MRRLVVIAALLLWIAGCASEREQNLQRFDAMHDSMRKTSPAQPPKWQLVPGDKN